MEKIRIIEFFDKCLFELRHAIPRSMHAWNNIIVKNHSITFSNRPPLLQNFDFQSPILNEISRFASDLAKDKEFILCRDDIYKKTNIKWNFLIPRLIAKHLLSDYLWNADSLSLDNRLVDEVSGNFLKFLESKKTEFVYFSILNGLETDFSIEEVTEGIFIKKLDDFQLCKILESSHKYQIKEDVLHNRVILEKRVVYKNGIPKNNSFSEISDEFNEIITSLRLLKNEHVGRGKMYSRIAKPGFIGHDEVTSSSYIYNTVPPFCKYFLDQASINKLEYIYKSIEKIKTQERLELALRRFENAQLNWNAEDQILDYVIGLEALFSENSENISYKIRMRAAKFISSNLFIEKKVVKLIQNAYSIRSKTAHGLSKRTKSFDLHRMSVELSGLLRICFFKYIQIIHDGGSIPSLSEIDDQLLK